MQIWDNWKYKLLLILKFVNIKIYSLYIVSTISIIKYIKYYIILQHYFRIYLKFICLEQNKAC